MRLQKEMSKGVELFKERLISRSLKSPREQLVKVVVIGVR